MYGVSTIHVYEDVALVNFKKIPANILLLSDIFDRIAKAGVIIDMISQTSPVGESVSISFTCEQSDLVKVLEITNELRNKHPQLQPLVSSGNCKITLDSDEMRTESGVFARAVSALAPSSVEIQQITTSETQISLLVSAAHAQDTNRILGDCFGIIAV